MEGQYYLSRKTPSEMLGYYFPFLSDLWNIFQNIQSEILQKQLHLSSEDFVSENHLHFTMCMVDLFNLNPSKKRSFYNYIQGTKTIKFPVILTIDGVKKIGPKTVLTFKRNGEIKPLIKFHQKIEEKLLNNYWGSVNYVSNFINGQFYVTLMHGRNNVCLDFELMDFLNKEFFKDNNFSFPLPCINIYQPFDNGIKEIKFS